ncbi:STAS domain-containing protein [Marinobacter sp. LV10MA510-1]|uniref:STAS domain-containing protein n=1 Tax=Marinobacter sp. LV10MA510-1 TaxID=1415567 RepID=UPI000BF86CB3|nr:STAS domain-containing protein [Marinobacter sp. LV10MA510-1]PFG09492.1 phospholipid transport system transporter-binding protein [Marinobacter sp. LV10MA510-1]
MSASNPQPTLNFSDNTLRIDGEADAMAAADLRQRGEVLLAGAKGDITVDLARLSSASSSLLSVLLCWQRFASERSLNLRFDHPGERLLALAALANLNDALPGFTTAGPGVNAD